jgi:hypothetical protein
MSIDETIKAIIKLINDKRGEWLWT